MKRTSPTDSLDCPYKQSHRMLIVGDGNFTFSLSLAKLLGGSNLVATSYDTKEELFKKYAEAEHVTQELLRLGARVLHGVDATNLEQTLNLGNLNSTHNTTAPIRSYYIPIPSCP